MRVSLGFVSTRGTAKSAAAETLADGYVARARRLAEVDSAGVREREGAAGLG